VNGLGPELVVQQAFGLAIVLLLPLVAAGVIAGTAASLLAARVGVQDPTVALVARALAVVLAIGLGIGSLSADTVAFTVGVWDGLGDVGRAPSP
jgi:flagellar biosynthesis protein FliQ